MTGPNNTNVMQLFSFENTALLNPTASQDLLKFALAVFLDVNTPQDGAAATVCKIGDPQRIDKKHLEAVRLTVLLSERLNGNTEALEDSQLEEATKALQHIQQRMRAIDILKYTDVYTGGNVYASLMGPAIAKRPDIPALSIIDYSKQDKLKIHANITENFNALLSQALEQQKFSGSSSQPAPTLPKTITAGASNKEQPTP